MANQSYIFEFDEADVWLSNDKSFDQTPLQLPAKKVVVPASFRAGKKRAERKTASSQGDEVTCASSLPVNIPDWSKIRRESYGGHALDHDHDHGDEGYDDIDGGGCKIPPHELLARRRGASFSVQEGIGRTLKGRDLRQVRNAIWKKVGFED